MKALRLIPFLAAAATATAQLPPGVLRPQQPGNTPATPAVPAIPATPAATPAAETAIPEDLANAVPNTLTPTEIAAGWKLLFDGNRLIGMRGLQKADPLAAGWKITAGELVLPKEIRDMDRITGGDLATVEQFWDFEFRFDWKSTVSANSGIRYLVSTQIGQAPSGLEYQIIDDVHNPLGLKGGALRRSGALDNIVPVSGNARLRSADPLNHRAEPWNEGRILVQGNTVQHWLNGELACQFQLGPHLRQTAEKNRDRQDRSPRPHALFGMKTKTPIVILDEGTEVSFRNLKIRPLPAQAVIAPPKQPGTTTRPAGNVPNPFLLPPKSSAGR